MVAAVNMAPRLFRMINTTEFGGPFGGFFGILLMLVTLLGVVMILLRAVGVME